MSLHTPMGAISWYGRLARHEPHLPEEERQRLTGELMDVRHAVTAARAAGDSAAEAAAHRAVNAAKQALRTCVG